jgi:hypothetical protein
MTTEGYWYAARFSNTNKGQNIKVLSRRMDTKTDAQAWADFEKSCIDRPCRNHSYIAIFIPSTTVV